MPGRVHSRRQFDRLARTSVTGRASSLRVRYAPSLEPSEEFSVAYAIGREVGGAVVRNGIRRRLRTLMDELRPNLQPGLYLIKCDITARELTYEQLRERLESALRAARVLG